METFWFGFFAGFLANWVFGMATRLLPAKWVRYRVNIGKLDRKEETGWGNWIVTVHIQPPKWKRALMEPLREYLLVQMKLGDRDWLTCNLVEGFDTFYLLADGARSVAALAFVDTGAGIYPADDHPLRPPSIVQDGNYDMRVRVIRSLDETVADEVCIYVNKSDGHVSAKIVESKQ